MVGQTASIEIDGKTYALKVSKIYPQVRNGQFRIDLVFDGPEPPSIQRGQTMSTKLTLGDSSRAVLIPNGAFFNDTGGNWVFVVDGNSADRRPVRLGRRNNFIEVLDGLKPASASSLHLQRAGRQGPPQLRHRRIEGTRPC